MSLQTPPRELPLADRNRLLVQRLSTWGGIVLLAVLIPVFVLACDLWPPPNPSWTPQEMAAFWADDVSLKRLGIAICVAGWTLMAPWTVALASITARSERGFRILSVTQIICGGSTMAIGVFMFLIWGVAAFRPGELSPETIRMLTDLGWFIFVMYWAPGTVWAWAVGLAIILDHRPTPVFPRWVAYLNFWTGLCYFPACLGLFFKTGPFAYNGAFTVWLPAIVFFVWFGVMSVLMLRATREEEQELLETSGATT